MPFLEAEGGPIRVRSLAEVDAPCDRLIWLGLATADAIGCRWSTNQLRELRAAGIDIDDGSKRLAAALCRGTRLLLRSRSRPRRLAPTGPRQAMAPDLACHSLSPSCPRRGIAARAGRHRRPRRAFVPRAVRFPVSGRSRYRRAEAAIALRVPHELLSDRTSVSATELQDRLACPLKWTLTYLGRLRPSPIAKLPDDFRLKGTFCHSILQRVFGGGGALPPVDVAVAKGSCRLR